jgi:CheY-like chemotaxis protein
MIKANCSPKQLVELVNKTLSGTASTPPPDFASMAAAFPPGMQPPAPPPALLSEGAPAEHDTSFQTEVRQNFLTGVSDQISELRALLQAFAKGDGESARLPKLFTLYRKIHTLTSNAAVSGLSTAAEMSSALEALLKELYEKPKNINSSTIRTVAQAIDLIAVLFERKSNLARPTATPPAILVVDDDAISRRAVVIALEKASLKCQELDEPVPALEVLSEKPFDLIFLDVNMPGMSGFDLCEKIRSIPQHSRTPVIFVTGLTDFESRTRSTLSGGTDMIAKPFLFMELAVKALTYLLKEQLAVAKS